MPNLNRRQFLETSFAGAAALSCGQYAIGANEKKEKLVACIVTEYRNNSHADVILGKILEGFDHAGGPRPALKVASLFTDQLPMGDMSRGMAEKHGFPIAKNIEEAITLGTNEVEVDGVLIIGEHGTYPFNVKGQHIYPRLRFFEDAAAVFRKYGRVVPVFSDKHLAYNWHDAAWMYETARGMRIPFLAGSSVPVSHRRPSLTLAMDCEIEGALGIAYGGVESYGFHGLEGLQCMIERRRGGETGVIAVEALQGEAMFRALDAGRWSRELLDAVLAVIPPKAGKVEDNCRNNKGAAVYLIDYSDGLRAAMAMLNGHAAQFAFAGKLKMQPEPLATWYYLQEGKPFGHFAYLLKAIEQMVQTGTPPYPVERTLLTTGILDAAMTSLYLGKRIETPHLAKIRYKAMDYPFAPLPDVGIDLLKDEKK